MKYHNFAGGAGFFYYLLLMLFNFVYVKIDFDKFLSVDAVRAEYGTLLVNVRIIR